MWAMISAFRPFWLMLNYVLDIRIQSADIEVEFVQLRTYRLDFATVFGWLLHFVHRFFKLRKFDFETSIWPSLI